MLEAAQRIGPASAPLSARDMLVSLANAQLALAKAIESLESVADVDRPPAPHVLARARYELSTAARTRMMVGSAATMLLRGALGDRAATILQQHRAMRAALDAFTRDYVSYWTLERVAADWPGYRKASAEKRALLRDSIQVEKDLLEPKLRLLF